MTAVCPYGPDPHCGNLTNILAFVDDLYQMFSEKFWKKTLTFPRRLQKI
jgi:hypothetical protein